MPIHYHLLLPHTQDANLSRYMRHLNGVYTQKYHVDADNYLLQLVRYIHRNPLKA